jgi:hypothetical protein
LARGALLQHWQHRLYLYQHSDSRGLPWTSTSSTSPSQTFWSKGLIVKLQGHQLRAGGDEVLDLLLGGDNYHCGGAWHTDPASDQKTRTLQY